MDRKEVEALLAAVESDYVVTIPTLTAETLAALCRTQLSVMDAPAADVQMLGSLILSDIDSGCMDLIGQRVRIVREEA